MNRTILAIFVAVMVTVLSVRPDWAVAGNRAGPWSLEGTLLADAAAEARRERQRLELQRLRKNREKAREKSTAPAPRGRFTRRRSSRPARAQEYLSLSLPPGWTEAEQGGEEAPAFAAWLAYRTGSAFYQLEG